MYYILKETVIDDRTAYGIAAVDEHGKTIISYADVSPDKAFVADLVRKINDAGLSPLHLLDVIQDNL